MSTASASPTRAAVARSWHALGFVPSNPIVVGWQAMSPTATTTNSSDEGEGSADADGDGASDVGPGVLGVPGGSVASEHSASRTSARAPTTRRSRTPIAAAVERRATLIGPR